MNYKIFKYKMQLYREYLFKIEDLENEREDTFYRFYGVHGVSFDRIPSSHSADMDIIRREKFNDIIERIDKEIEGYKEEIAKYEEILSSLPDKVQKMARRKFIDGCIFQQVGDEFGYSMNAIYKKIKTEVEKL